MQIAPPDYQTLYENTLLEAQQAKATIGPLQEKLSLALFELNKMRRQLFGPSADLKVCYLICSSAGNNESDFERTRFIAKRYTPFKRSRWIWQKLVKSFIMKSPPTRLCS